MWNRRCGFFLSTLLGPRRPALLHLPPSCPNVMPWCLLNILNNHQRLSAYQIVGTEVFKIYEIVYLNSDSFIESFPRMCFEGNWLQNRLRADKNESRSLLAVDIKGHQRGGFCIVPTWIVITRVNQLESHISVTYAECVFQWDSVCIFIIRLNQVNKHNLLRPNQAKFQQHFLIRGKRE